MLYITERDARQAGLSFQNAPIWNGAIQGCRRLPCRRHAEALQPCILPDKSLAVHRLDGEPANGDNRHP
jgi:hypothetical protein